MKEIFLITIQGSQKMEWFSVKEVLPKEINPETSCPYDAVLVCSTSSKSGPLPLFGIAAWSEDGWEILGNEGAHSCTGFYSLESKDITHWAYIDAPSKERPGNHKLDLC